MFGNSNNELRQKLINLMYLVFITLAFIYLPSDFIDSSKYLKRTFEQNEQEFALKTANQKSLLNEQLYLNTPLAQDYYNIMDIALAIDSATAHINRMQSTLELNVGGYNGNNYINKSKNFLLSSNLLVDDGRASVLEAQIEAIKERVRGHNLANITPFLDSLLPTNIKIVNSKGKNKTWESYFFSKTPVAMVSTNLSKIKADLAYTKLKLVEYLINNVSNGNSDKNVSILSSNSIAVEVLAAKSFELGDKIAFKVILLDSLRKGKGNGSGGASGGDYSGIKTYLKKGGKFIKTLNIGDGGIVSFTANETGKFELVVEDSAKVNTQNFTVTNLRNAYTEKNSPEIMYLGIDNPILIQTSRLEGQEIETEIDMGEVIPFGGKYYLRFTSEGLAHLKVYAKNKDGRFLVTEKTYEVKKLPTPSILLDGKAGGNISQKILQVQNKLVALAPNIDVNDIYNILSFEVIWVHSRGKESVVNRGETFTYEARKLLRETKSGDLVVIDNIKIKATDGTLKDVAPIVFSVK